MKSVKLERARSARLVPYYMLTAFLLFLNSAVADQDREERREQARIQQLETSQWLYSEFQFEALERPVTARLTRAEMDEIDNANRSVSPMKVGLSKPANAAVNLAEFAALKSGRPWVGKEAGAANATEDGGFVYSMTLHSPGAAAMRGAGS